MADGPSKEALKGANREVRVQKKWIDHAGPLTGISVPYLKPDELSKAKFQWPGFIFPAIEASQSEPSQKVLRLVSRCPLGGHGTHLLYVDLAAPSVEEPLICKDAPRLICTEAPVAADGCSAEACTFVRLRVFLRQ
jgi:hypothetical protein